MIRTMSVGEQVGAPGGVVRSGPNRPASVGVPEPLASATGVVPLETGVRVASFVGEGVVAAVSETQVITCPLQRHDPAMARACAARLGDLELGG